MDEAQNKMERKNEVLIDHHIKIFSVFITLPTFSSCLIMIYVKDIKIAMSNSSNENRREYRRKCRQKMSDHICKCLRFMFCVIN